MAAAALTPRVRVTVVCDLAKRSRIDDGVFNLLGVRYRLKSASFPFRPKRLWLYLLLSSIRKGRYPGYVLVNNDQTGKTIFRGNFDSEFEEEFEFLAVNTPLRCRFPQPGRYTIQVCFFQMETADVVKAEQEFFVHEDA